MSVGYEAELDDAKRKLVRIFGKSQAHEIYRYSASIIETEKYVMFTKYIRKLVIEYLHAYLLNIICDLWEKTQENNNEVPLTYIQQHSIKLQHKLYSTALYLVGKRIVFDYMSTNHIKEELVNFFSDVEIDGKVYKNIKEFAVFNSTFQENESDVISVSETLHNKKKVLEVILKTYLTVKENIYQDLGYDVTLEYNNIRDFSFVYNDPRLNTDDEKPLAIEYKVIQATVNILDPEGKGDIMKFLKQIRPEDYGSIAE
tara:strand:- start:10328 stop:11098 length:771 start_codon:yes stop_codon:yes gene_type:complete